MNLAGKVPLSAAPVAPRARSSYRIESVDQSQGDAPARAWSLDDAREGCASDGRGLVAMTEYLAAQAVKLENASRGRALSTGIGDQNHDGACPSLHRYAHLVPEQSDCSDNWAFVTRCVVDQKELLPAEGDGGCEGDGSAPAGCSALFQIEGEDNARGRGCHEYEILS